jgi:hypothetical protein
MGIFVLYHTNKMQLNSSILPTSDIKSSPTHTFFHFDMKENNDMKVFFELLITINFFLRSCLQNTIKLHHIVYVGVLNNIHKIFSNPYVLKLM